MTGVQTCALPISAVALDCLLRNALLHPAPGTRAVIAARIVGGGIAFSVTDRGPGVPAAVQAQVFQPFTTGGRAGGAGLGLAIARDLVRAHGGDIALLESNGKGTIFQFTLPA